MDLPGLKESIEEMRLIGGVEMDKPKSAGITNETARLANIAGTANAFSLKEEEIPPPSDSDLLQGFASHTIALQKTFMEIIEENLKLRADNKKLLSRITKAMEDLEG